jgi:hypothetical protein
MMSLTIIRSRVEHGESCENQRIPEDGGGAAHGRRGAGGRDGGGFSGAGAGRTSSITPSAGCWRSSSLRLPSVSRMSGRLAVDPRMNVAFSPPKMLADPVSRQPHTRHLSRTVRSGTASMSATSRADIMRLEPPGVPLRGFACSLSAVTSLSSLLQEGAFRAFTLPSPPLGPRRWGSLVLRAHTTLRACLTGRLVSSAAYARLRADARARGETRRPVRRSLMVTAPRWSVRASVPG